MQTEIIVAIVAGLGTLSGSFFGVVMSSSKTLYRLDKLEEKQDKHNQLIERMYQVEDRAKSAHHRIDRLEKINE